MANAQLYVAPRQVSDPSGCHFYHRMEIPGYGLTAGGMWDLRGNVEAYLGGIELSGKRVLEIGPASGFLTFYMESRGADVVSVELPPDHDWDVVPDVSLDLAGFVKETQENIEHVRDAYWFAHERFQSKANIYYGDVYNLPDDLGHFDVAVIASLLLHVRNPLQVVEGCARLSDSLVITDMHFPDVPDDVPTMTLYSSQAAPVPHVWWKFSPQIFVRFGEVLGFTKNTVTFHDQVYIADGEPRPGEMYTVVSTNKSTSA